MLPVTDEVLDELAGPRLGWLSGVLERHFFAQLYDPAATSTPIRLRRALWGMAVHPWQNGLGRARPWRLRIPTVVGKHQVPIQPEAGGRGRRSFKSLRYLIQLLTPPSEARSARQEDG